MNRTDPGGFPPKRARELTYGYGLLLPHFGSRASRELILQTAEQAELYGFSSLWTRDHVVYEPHRMEDPDNTHIDPFLTLSLVAGATRHITLGTASLIPHRHPLHLALSLGSLRVLAGQGRVIAGVGTGGFDHEFEAIGLGGIRRKKLLVEQLDIIRRVSDGSVVSYEGAFYRFTDVRLKPVVGEIPFWLCTTSAATLEWAVDGFSGWLPGRMTLKTYTQRLQKLHALCAERQRTGFEAGAIPITSPARTLEEGLARVDWRSMLNQATSNHWVLPDSGEWASPQDLEGALIAGPPETIIEVTDRYQQAGLTHIVYDLRSRFDDLAECVAILGEEVLPHLRRGVVPDLTR